MAVGDAAGAKGLKTYSDATLINDVDVALNQRGDDIAAVMTRADALEKATIKVPKFSVAKSTNGQNLAFDTAAVFTAGAWGSPVKTVGGFTWSGGVLTVPRAGVYSVLATMKVAANDYYAIYVMVTKNTTTTDSAFAVARGVVYPGDRSSNNSSNVAPSVTASRMLVSLNAGDTLRVVGYQRNYGGQTVGLDDGATSLTFEVMWQDEL